MRERRPASASLSPAWLGWISVPYVVAGLVAPSRRLESRLNALMIAGGFASGLSALQFAQIEVGFIFWIGLGLVIGGAVLLLRGAAMIYLSVRRPGRITSAAAPAAV